MAEPRRPTPMSPMVSICTYCIAASIREESAVKFGGMAADKCSMDERRSERRMLCADMVEVRWSDRSGQERMATAILEDISVSGACLQLETPIPLGVEVNWDAPNQQFHGYARYCVYREIGY